MARVNQFPAIFVGKQMKVYTFVDDWLGYVFRRVDKAFHDWAPANIVWVETPEEADIQIVHVIGKGELKNIKNKNYAVVQYCYHTQDIPEEQLKELWENALLVSSFHDFPSYRPEWNFRFYGMPIGAEDNIFFNTSSLTDRARAVLSTGHVPGTESLEELFTACSRSGYKMLHLGKDFGWDSEIFKHYEWVSDEVLRNLYNTVAYTSCLRRVEGFEVAAIEGLMCGARPITFDLSPYRWYHKFAVVIKDTNPDDITKQLTNVLTNGLGLPVRQDEIDEVIREFSWSTLIPRFWGAVQEAWNGRG